MSPLEPSNWQNYRIRIYPTEEQKEKIFFMMDCFRYVYNWSLAYHIEHYHTEKKGLTKIDLAQAMEKHRHETEWLEQCDLTSCRFAAWNVSDAFDRFYKTKNPKEYPKFKKKSRAKQTVQLRGERVRLFENGTAQLPGITNRSNRMQCKKHHIPTDPHAKYMNVYVTYDGNRFWLTMSVPMRRPFVPADLKKIKRNAGLGVDVGVRTSAYASDGTEYKAPNPHRIAVLNNRIQKLQAAITRDRKRRCVESMRTKTKYVDLPISKNEAKRESRYRQAYIDMHNLLATHYHNISKDIVLKNPQFVAIEDLDIRDLQQHTKSSISKQMHDRRLGMLLHFIEYKCADAYIPVIRAPRNYPSSQLCSRCGTRTKIGGDKIYQCPYCGFVIDRDYNAAINLQKYGYEVYE